MLNIPGLLTILAANSSKRKRCSNQFSIARTFDCRSGAILHFLDLNCVAKEPNGGGGPNLTQNRLVPMANLQFTESALLDTAEQFHILVDSVEEYAIYMLDPSGNVVTWNRGAQKIKGYTAEEIIGKNFACFYTAEDVAADKPEHNLREAARLGHIRDQGLRVRKDGSTFEAEVVLTALCDPKGNLRGYSKVTRDITDQIRSREFEAENIASQKASKAKDDFLAALSHELRTPLTPALAAV